MICLGIESTAHTFGIGILKNSKVLADKRSVYKPKSGWGIIPNECAKHHKMVKNRLLESALNEAGIDINSVDVISYACGPGLPPCLLVGAELAYYLSKKYGKNLIKVHHGIAHIEIGRFLNDVSDPIILYLSGGHNCILTFVDDSYKILGETLDITCANAIDTLAREIGIKPPYGQNFDKYALRGKKFINLPYVVKGMDLSFSGILTAALKEFKRGVRKEDICYSMQEVCFSMITEVTERALAHTGKDEVLVVGGLGASKRLREMLSIMCKERGAKLFFTPPEYSRDNGVMIAITALLICKKCKTLPKIKEKILPKWRIDNVSICWVK